MDINPVWIKEWRQVSRSRFAQGLNLMLLLLLWVSMAFCLLAQLRHDVWTIEFSPSRLLANLIWLILAGAILAITLDIYARTSHEWRPAARDLVFSTSLTPLQMLTGKIMTCLSLNGFVLSLALPFLLVASRLLGSHNQPGLTQSEIFQGLATLCLLSLFVQGAAIAAAVINLPRPLALLAGGYLFAFIGWRPIFLRPEQLVSLQLFLIGHALLAWLVASFALLPPAAARRSRRLLWGIPIVLALAYNDWNFYNSFTIGLRNLLSQVMVLAAAGYLATLALLAWIYWTRQETGRNSLLGDHLSAWLARWRQPRLTPPEPLATPVPVASVAPAASPELAELPWLPRLERPRPAAQVAAWGEASEFNPVFIKVMRALVRQRFFILLPAIAIGFVLAIFLLQQIFKHTLVDNWPLYHFFFRTFLLLDLMLFWSMSYEIVYRTLEEWSGETAGTDPIRLSPLGGYRILIGLLLVGVLTMPLPWLATLPTIWLSGLLDGWDPYFWSSIEVLALASIAIYLWTLAVSFWTAPRSFKLVFSLILMAAIYSRSLWLSPSLRWDFAGYAVLFAGLAASGLTTPWRRRWWPLLLHFIVGATFLGFRGYLFEETLAASLQIAAFAIAYLLLLHEHRWR